MNFFNTILEKLGLRKTQPTPVAPLPTAANRPAVPAGKPNASIAAGKKDNVSTYHQTGQTAVKEAPPRAISEVDVVSKLEKLSVGSGLNWKVSIVDLMKLLDIDSSFQARKELAIELGCPPDLMKDSASMNIWLHKTVLQKIAENGGNIPRSLLN